MKRISKKFIKRRYTLPMTAEKTIESSPNLGFDTESSSNLWDEVSHNLVDLNAKAIQEIVNLIPEDDTYASGHEVINKIEDIIKNNLFETAETIFRTKRYLSGMAAEFSVVEKLVRNRPLQKIKANLRNIIIGVLHLFTDDFNRKNITINIEEWYQSSIVDYETVRVALYYFIGNCAKYIQENTKLEISFRINKNNTNATFKMTSLYISPEDEEKIFRKERYSGSMACKARLNGKGIGMYRAQKLLCLNGGKIVVVPGEPITMGDILYAKNSFTIELPLAD